MDSAVRFLEQHSRHLVIAIDARIAGAIIRNSKVESRRQKDIRKMERGWVNEERERGGGGGTMGMSKYVHSHFKYFLPESKLLHPSEEKKSIVGVGGGVIHFNKRMGTFAPN